MLTDAGGCDHGRWGVDWFVTVTRCLDRRCNGHMTRNMRESRIVGLEAIWRAWINVSMKDLPVWDYGNQCEMLGIYAKARKTRLL